MSRDIVKRKTYVFQPTIDEEADIPRKIQCFDSDCDSEITPPPRKMVDSSDQFEKLMAEFTKVNRRLDHHEHRMNTISQNQGAPLGASGSSPVVPQPGAANVRHDINDWVNTRRGTGPSNARHRDAEPDVEVVAEQYNPPPMNRGRFSDYRQRGGRGRGWRGSHNRFDPYQYSRPRHRSEIEDDYHLGDDEQGFEDDPFPRRRASHSGGQSTWELTKLMRREIMAQKCHDEAASYEVIIDGLPSNPNDKIPDEVKRATDSLKEVMPDFKAENIDGVNRLYTPNDDGSLPLVVTLIRQSLAIELTERARFNPDFGWLRPSRSREMRKRISYEVQRVERLNKGLSRDSPTAWETRHLGTGIITRRIPNPGYVQRREHTHRPNGAGTQTQNQRPLAASGSGLVRNRTTPIGDQTMMSETNGGH